MEQLQPNPHTKSLRGVTLMELLTVIAVLTILAGIAIPAVLSAIRETKARQCGSALRLIESAKERWRTEYPAAPISSVSQLSKYFPNGHYPQDPWKVNGFRSETDLNNVATHIYDRNTNYGDKLGTAGTNNGLNDAGQPP